MSREARQSDDMRMITGVRDSECSDPPRKINQFTAIAFLSQSNYYIFRTAVRGPDSGADLPAHQSAAVLRGQNLGRGE